MKYSGGPRPGYKTPGSSGADLCARIDHDITIPPGGWALIPTGIRVQIPPGYEGQV
ncbi:dUTP diphosphatase, partial [candidate division WOR-3 bacterium]